MHRSGLISSLAREMSVVRISPVEPEPRAWVLVFILYPNFTLAFGFQQKICVSTTWVVLRVLIISDQ
jgi:hypothetical protein